MTRTDVHRPTELVTEDYEYVFADVNHVDGTPGWVVRNGDYGLQLARWVAATDKLDRGTHQCHHCGAHLNYFAILRHLPTGDAIVVGETCLYNRFERATVDFQRLRKQAELDRQAFRIRTAVAEFVTANPDLAFLADKGHEHTNDFVADVARKLRLYGELTEKQVTAIRKAIVRDAEREAQRAAEDAEPKEPVPTGRVQITGTIVGTKLVAGYGYHDADVLKLIVKDERGFKVYVTCPAALDGNRGDRVTFTAAVTPADDDPYFGFAKRPTKAAVIEEGTGLL